MFVQNKDIETVLERRKTKILSNDFFHQNKELQLTNEQLRSIPPEIVFAWVKDNKITFKHFIRWKESLCQNV